jgi:hypothetical protein
MANRNQEDLLFLRDHTLRVEGIDTLVATVWMILCWSPHDCQALAAINSYEWDKAAALSNSILRRVHQQREAIDKKRILELKTEPKGERRAPLAPSSPSPWVQFAIIALRDVAMAAAASAAVSFLLFSFFGALLSRFKINNRR